MTVLVAGHDLGAHRRHFHSLPMSESQFNWSSDPSGLFQGNIVDDRPGSRGAGAGRDSCLTRASGSLAWRLFHGDLK